MKFPVVCICGSTRFEEETKMMAELLTLKGQIVLMVNCWSKKDKLHDPKNAIDEATKAKLDAIHKEKIRMSDYVLVMNVNGYWGKSTQSEIEYAQKIGIPVEYLEPTSDNKSFENATPCQRSSATEPLVISSASTVKRTIGNIPLKESQ
jgi:hypothetical protein